MMKAKYLGRSGGISLTENKAYEVLGFENGFVRIIDDAGRDYLCDLGQFKIMED